VLCLHYGIARTPPGPDRPPLDLFGLASLGVGLALIYAGLDQGNRLDWLGSGVVAGLILAGMILVAAFFVHEAVTPRPLIDLKVALAKPMPRLLLLVAFLRLTILATAFLIPQYLQVVRGYRALDVGKTLIWIAAPQLIICPLAAVMLRRMDARLVSSIGFLCVSIACLMVAYGLTPLWSSDEFLPSGLLQAVGQSFALSGIVFFGILHLRPQDALTFGASVQVARLMGGQIGQAFVSTLTRVRTQTASNLIGLHLQAGDAMVNTRLAAYAAVARKSDPDPTRATARAAAILGNVVRSAAATQGIIDAFVVVSALTVIALMIAVAHKPAPIGPASHLPFFAKREAN